MRLIGIDGDQIGIVSIEDALKAASEAGVDLVEMSADASPTVCRLMDFGKFLFEEKKRKAEAKKKQKQFQLKEIKFRPTTDEGDYKIKMKRITQFLEDGDKVKVTIRFRGREMSHQEFGMRLIKRIVAELDETVVVEQEAKLEGKQMAMVVAPARKKR